MWKVRDDITFESVAGTKQCITSEGEFILNDEPMGPGYWITDNRFVVSVEAWMGKY